MANATTAEKVTQVHLALTPAEARMVFHRLNAGNGTSMDDYEENNEYTEDTQLCWDVWAALRELRLPEVSDYDGE